MIFWKYVCLGLERMADVEFFGNLYVWDWGEWLMWIFWKPVCLGLERMADVDFLETCMFGTGENG